MKVLKFSEYYLTFLGICSHKLDVPTNEFLKSINAYIFLIGFFGPLCGFSAAYIYQNLSDLETSTNALLVLSAGMAASGAYISIGVNMKTVKRMHNELQKIVDNGRKHNRILFTSQHKILMKNNIFSKAERNGFADIYRKAERNGRLCTKWISLYVVVNCTLCAFLMAIVHSIVCMWRGNYQTSTWFLPYKMSVPFDTSTVFGWYIFWLVQIYAGYTYLFTISAVITYFVSCCFHIVACCEQFLYMFNALDSQFVEDVEMNYQNVLKVKKQLNDAIVFHIKIMEYDSFRLLRRKSW